MAKHLKQNQIKAGITIYVVHPNFSDITEKFITSKPNKDKDGCHNFVKFGYLPVRHFTITDKGISERNNSSYRTWWKEEQEWKVRSGFCGDDGIPDKDGKFCYTQERRAFPTLKKAIAYWVSQQTDENKAKWALRDLENEAWEM